MHPPIGVWIDDPAKDVVKPAYWDVVAEHGVSTAALFLETMSVGFDPKYGVERLQQIREHALSRDIEIVLTVWPEPTIQWLSEFEARIEAMLTAAGAAGLEFDAEGGWLKKKVQDFPDLDKAGDALVAVFQRLATTLDVRSELTTYAYHVECSRTADVAPHADRLLPQAYSVAHRDGKDGPYVVGWNDPMGPGRMQKLTLDRAVQVPGVGTSSGPLICCGLAAYDQKWDGHTAEEAMRVAYEAALKYDPTEIRWWSSKWLWGVKANSYAGKFLKSIK